MLRSKPEYPLTPDTDYSGRQAVCPHRFSDLRQSRSQGGTFRWRSARRSRFSIRKAIRCRRSGVGWGGLPRPSPESSIAMQPPTAARWPIGRRPLSGMPIDRLVALRLPSLRTTLSCVLMWKNVFPAPLRRQARGVVVLFDERRLGRKRAKIGDGRRPGAPSRLPDACRSTFRMTRRCASATKLFIKLFSCRAVELYAVNWRPVCEADVRYAYPGHVRVSEAKALSRRRS